MARYNFGSNNGSDPDTPDSAVTGFNGFPWPAQEGITSNRQKVDFEHATKWWWRVKNWTMVSTCFFTDYLGNVYAFNDGAMDRNTLIVDEDDLRKQDASLSPSFTSNTSGGASPFILELFGVGGTFAGVVTKDPPDIYLPLDSLAIGGGLGTGGIGGGVTFYWGNSGPPDGTINMNVDGVTIPISYTVDPGGGGGPTTGHFTTGSITFTPSEFWGWDGTYDTATGQTIGNVFGWRG